MTISGITFTSIPLPKLDKLKPECVLVAERWNIRSWHAAGLFSHFKTNGMLANNKNLELLCILIEVAHAGSVTRLGDLLDFGQVFKALGKINLAKSPTFLGNFCKGVKIYHFSSEIIFRQLL